VLIAIALPAARDGHLEGTVEDGTALYLVTSYRSSELEPNP